MIHAAQGNQLAGALSPYLQQHKDNPVHWQEWGRDALAQARAGNKPILLSIGYAACHWCHVMAHESFEDVETAGLMNELFVSIKVDREERPDIDQIYMTALHALGQQGGWPLTMFLTPEGKPFWGGTYFPKHRQPGRPSFKDVLRGISIAFQQDRETISKNESAIFDAISHSLAAPKLASESFDRVDPFYQFGPRFQRLLDPANGGVGTAPKFPNATLWEGFWRYALRSNHRGAHEACLLWLESLCQGGIYDHIGGGFSRYTVDERWLVPHFEKMLYDNALLLRCLALAHSRNPRDLFRRRIEETIGFLTREMRDDKGGLTSSFDADSEGEEGKFYVWTHQQINEALGEDAGFFSRLHDVTEVGNWEGHVILNRLDHRVDQDSETEARARNCLDRLMAVREKRTPPGRDDKVLTDWNGLAIRAIADCAMVLDHPEWLLLSGQIYDAVVASTDGQGRLCHASRDRRKTYPCLLSDLASIINAGVTLFAATGNSKYIVDAETFLDQADRWFGDGQGTHFFTASDGHGLLLRTYHDHDEATPSASGQMAEALARLALVSNRPDLPERAEIYSQRLSSRISAHPQATASAINAADSANQAQKLEISKGDRPMIEAALRYHDPARLIILTNPAHQTAGTAIHCLKNNCLPPILGVTSLDEALRLNESR